MVPMGSMVDVRQQRTIPYPYVHRRRPVYRSRERNPTMQADRFVERMASVEFVFGHLRYERSTNAYPNVSRWKRLPQSDFQYRKAPVFASATGLSEMERLVGLDEMHETVRRWRAIEDSYLPVRSRRSEQQRHSSVETGLVRRCIQGNFEMQHSSVPGGQVVGLDGLDTMHDHVRY